MAPKPPRRPLPLARWTSRHPWVTRIVAAAYFANFMAVAVSNVREGTWSGLFFGVVVLATGSFVCWWWAFSLPRQVAAYDKHLAGDEAVGGDPRSGEGATARASSPLPRPEAGDG